LFSVFGYFSVGWYWVPFLLGLLWCVWVGTRRWLHSWISHSVLPWLGESCSFIQGQDVLRRQKLHYSYLRMKSLGCSAILIAVSVCASPVLAQTCSNQIIVGGQATCLRRMSTEEVRLSRKHYRGKALDRMERSAERSIQQGYDPDVSLEEFRNRLNRRSNIWDAQRELRFSD